MAQDIHFLRDFEAVLMPVGLEGEAMDWPDFDFVARFYTRKAGRFYTASCIGGVERNCYRREDGKLVVVFDRHGLSCGRLEVLMMALLPNSRMPDGVEQVPLRVATGIRLVPVVADLPAEISMAVQLPVYIRNFEKDMAGLAEFKELIGGTFDEINRGLEAILGREPAAPEEPDEPIKPVKARQASPTAPRFLQRGVIPLHAQPGVLYRNKGIISLRGVDIAEGVETVFDISAVPQEWRAEIYVSLIGGYYNALFHGAFDCAIEGNTLTVFGRKPNNTFGLASLCIVLPESYRSGYIEKGADGIFRVYTGPMNVTEPGLDPLHALKSGTVSCGDRICDMIAEIVGYKGSGCNLEIQYRQKRRFGGRRDGCWYSGTSDGYRTKWRRYRHAYVGGLEGCSYSEYLRRRVLRVRQKNSKGRVSPWLYLFLTPSPFESEIKYIRL